MRERLCKAVEEGRRAASDCEGANDHHCAARRLVSTFFIAASLPRFHLFHSMTLPFAEVLQTSGDSATRHCIHGHASTFTHVMCNSTRLYTV